MTYEDLLSVPYNHLGRDMDGMDCYGFAIECFRRDGKALKDLAATPDGNLDEYARTTNVREVSAGAPGVGAQFYINSRLHVGYMLDRRTVIHMTDRGVRITPVHALGPCRFFEVLDANDVL